MSHVSIVLIFYTSSESMSLFVLQSRSIILPPSQYLLSPPSLPALLLSLYARIPIPGSVTQHKSITAKYSHRGQFLFSSFILSSLFDSFTCVRPDPSHNLSSGFLFVCPLDDGLADAYTGNLTAKSSTGALLKLRKDTVRSFIRP
ncbi:hypothetical protein BCIN_06g04340 [Botrytis cinerea B05.10]|uniref:Uncharacterized protein n=1 Tax=Botryotinia fuckeliana (strain B05.10) TaxID=332648 RepID=A0A384JK57_BOTFB|nr:hypothetical protein BCIN_06g04340 [Botrytis cinerea B05.10]ATZ50975.1 hypothetical protein BCIN_06g04340 [Botrytis cinerea B05.10]